MTKKSITLYIVQNAQFDEAGGNLIPFARAFTSLEKACRTVEPRLYISVMDYQKGTVTLGMHYDNFDQDDFMSVNVASDSVPAAFYDVYTCAYERCI